MIKGKIGLIVNPIAGIGGAVGLKGSDGREIQERAAALGAKITAQERTKRALEKISLDGSSPTIVTYPGEMGESVSRECGFDPMVIGTITPGFTSAADTKMAAAQMSAMGVRLILFTGGDGTARDVASVVGTDVPVVGIPAGVKMHSAVFTNTPQGAGELINLVVSGRVSRYKDAEVMDLDESSYRRGEIRPKLFGYMRVPAAGALLQSRKWPSSASDVEAQSALAAWTCDHMEDGCLYILGPGTTTRSVTEKLGLRKTLVGVDVVQDRKLLGEDVNESELLALLEGKRSKIIVTPIGGQGHVFGRGNQQISAEVIRTAGVDNVIVLCTPEKLHSFMGQPLLVDSGDAAVDALLTGYMRIVLGYNEFAVYRIQS